MSTTTSAFIYNSTTKKAVIARSCCEIQFDTEQDLLKCVQALKESDERMSQRPEEMVTYEWDNHIQSGSKLFFGVKWYDADFFEARKEAYKSSLHEHVFSKFGAKVDDFQVNHYVLAS